MDKFARNLSRSKSSGLKQNTEDYSIANPATKPYDPTAENTITIGQNAEQNVQAVQDYRQGYLTEDRAYKISTSMHKIQSSTLKTQQLT